MFTYNAKLLKVIDGDTLEVFIDLGFDIWFKARLRLLGINTAEIHTKDKVKKKKGLTAKEFVEKELNSAEQIIIKSEKQIKKGKYGRYLVRVYYTKPGGNVICLNDLLLSEHLAQKYLGGKELKYKI